MNMLKFFQSTRPVGRATRGKCAAKKNRALLAVEQLEDRLVPTTILTGVDMTTMATTLGGYPHSGPTHLYLNFDGAAAVTPAGLSDQTIQEILFRTSEIYSPFNVVVSRLTGSGSADSSSDGGTTIFIGNNPEGDTYTPDENTDYPHVSNLYRDLPNSHANDLAYVEPGGKNTGTTAAAISRALAHEAGHTFGLAHVRTDVDASGTYQTDPTPLGTGTLPDIMSYTDGGTYFANSSLLLTEFNYEPASGTTITPSLQPLYMDNFLYPTLEIIPSTQNSFAYLQTVLGPRPDEAGYRVANADTIDPHLVDFYQPQVDTLGTSLDLTHSGTIIQPGDYDVSRWTAPRDETLRVTALKGPSSALSPVLLVYDAAGNLVLFNDSTSHNTSLTVRAGMSYFFVVGAQDGNSTGTYNLDILQEQHTFFVSIDSLTDPLHVPPTRGGVTDSASVNIGGKAGYFWSTNVYYQVLPVTANEGSVPIEIDVERIWHAKVIHGTPKLIGDEWYVDFHDGTGLHDLHFDSSYGLADVLASGFCTIVTTPPSTADFGTVWTINLTYDLASQTISGTATDGTGHTQFFDGLLPGKPIRVYDMPLPGIYEGGKLPDITFTISMDAPVYPSGTTLRYIDVSSLISSLSDFSPPQLSWLTPSGHFRLLAPPSLGHSLNQSPGLIDAFFAIEAFGGKKHHKSPANKPVPPINNIPPHDMLFSHGLNTTLDLTQGAF
jgi:hypothetical protein